jgi:hypothetical protein
MDQELKEYLQGMEGRLNANLEAKLDEKLDSKLGGLEARLEAKLEAKLDEKLGSMEVRLRQHAVDVETSLLTEFWKWARTSDLKSRQAISDVAFMAERMSAVEDRVRELEFRRSA